MKFIISLGAVLFLLVTPPPPPAQADSVQMQCPASVKEGGLVAHAAFDCAPNGWEYCEYRDAPGHNDWTEFDAPDPIRTRPRAYITINATTGGRWVIVADGLPIIIASADGGAGIQRHTIQAGTTRKIEVMVFGRANYRKEGNTTGRISVVLPEGRLDDPIASCTVTVQDDDNTAYVGSRYYHPYGGVWQETPHCYDEVGCASRQ